MLNLLKCTMFANKLFLAKTAIVYPPKALKKRCIHLSNSEM